MPSLTPRPVRRRPESIDATARRFAAEVSRQVAVRHTPRRRTVDVLLVSAARAATASSAREAPPATSPRSSCTPAGTTPRPGKGDSSASRGRPRRGGLGARPRRWRRCRAMLPPTPARSGAVGGSGFPPLRRLAEGSKLERADATFQSRARAASSAALLANRSPCGRPLPGCVTPLHSPDLCHGPDASPQAATRALLGPTRAHPFAPPNLAGCLTTRPAWTWPRAAVGGLRRDGGGGGGAATTPARGERDRGDIRGDHLAGGDAVHPAVLVASRDHARLLGRGREATEGAAERPRPQGRRGPTRIGRERGIRAWKTTSTRGRGWSRGGG